jgi:hypothetical protein
VREAREYPISNKEYPISNGDTAFPMVIDHSVLMIGYSSKVLIPQF